MSFSLFAHFYAYVLEGLVDCGESEIVIEALKNFEKMDILMTAELFMHITMYAGHAQQQIFNLQ